MPTENTVEKKFRGAARIPVRPLSIEDKELARPKELLVDYEKGIFYVCLKDGEIVDITEVAMKNLTVNATIVKSATFDVVLKEATEDEEAEIIHITLDEAICQTIKDIYDLKTKNESTSKTLETQDSDIKGLKTSVNALQKNVDANFLIINTTILGGLDNWVLGDDGNLYIQTINVADILESDYPDVDIVLSDDYHKAMSQLENYGFIFKILTFDGHIDVYATEPISVDLNIYLKTDRKNIDQVEGE